jgi:type II secretory pathway component GspD/PulD (secretin)
MRTLLSAVALCSLALLASAADDDRAKDDSALAAKTRKLLQTKISVEFKDTRLEDVLEDVKDQVKGLKFLIDSKGGVSRNSTFTYKAKDKTVAEVLDEMFKKPDLGYIILSKKGNAYDGLVQIRKGKERGFPDKK